MNRLLSLASFLAFGWTLSVYAVERPAGVPLEARWVKVDRVTDGDTIVLMDRTRVRLHGVDTPERDQLYGPMATAALEYMVARSVYLVEVDEDRYGRLVGQLFHSKEGKAMTSTLRWCARGTHGGTNVTHRIARLLVTVRSRQSKRRRDCGRTKIPCRRGSGVADDRH